MSGQKRIGFSLIVILAVFCMVSAAKTPQQLRTEIDALLPEGKKARMVWSEKPAAGENWTVYVCDSDDGIIRELTPASLFPNNHRSVPNAVLSRDGETVVVKEMLSGTVYAIGWDGTNLRQLLDYACIGHSWQDPDTRAQYVMAAELSESGTWLVNLATPSDRRKIWNSGLCDEAVGGTDGVGISVDGQQIGSFFETENGWKSGLATVPNGNPVLGSCNGCNFAMRPTTGGVFEYSHFPNGHDEVCVHNADGSVKGIVDVASTVRSWADSHAPFEEGAGEPVILMWTNDPEYVSYQWGGWSVGPVLYCVTDKKWVAMRDDLGGNSVNRFSVVFMPVDGSTSQKSALSPVSASPASPARARYMQGSGNLHIAVGARGTTVIHDLRGRVVNATGYR